MDGKLSPVNNFDIFFHQIVNNNIFDGQSPFVITYTWASLSSVSFAMLVTSKRVNTYNLTIGYFSVHVAYFEW